jgi:DNA replication protein DnaC
MTNYIKEGTPGEPTPVSKLAIQTAIKFCPICNYTMQNGICLHCKEEKQFQITAGIERKNFDIKRLGGLKAYEQFTLDKYTNKPAIELCEGFPDKNLFIWGSAGTGKTHLATAIMRGYGSGWIFKPQQIYRDCRGLKSGYDEQAAINKYVNIPFLVIDDLGVEKKTDFSFSTLYEIIEGRDMAFKNGMIITSNLNLNSLAERLGDDRITSRIIGMCRIIELSGQDWRMKKDKI